MANMKCPYCGGQYCDFIKRDESYEATTYHYYCNGCKKNFSVKSSRSKASGDWLLTFHLSSPHGTVQFYRKPNGSVFFNKIVSYFNEDKGLYGEYDDPIFSTHYESPMLYVTGIDFWLKDDGRSMCVSHIELSPSLTAKALQNEVMKTVHASGNSFVVKNIRNQELLTDVCLWIRPIINATDFHSGKKRNGCYVATCVYGSYDCPQVWTLRRFRDNALVPTWYGRAFIRTYYAVSPTLVKWFGNTAWFKKLWRGKLDSLVRVLQSKGVEDTPYTDMTW